MTKPPEDPRESFSLDGQGGAWQPEARSDGRRWMPATMTGMLDQVARKRREREEGGKR